MYGVFYICKHSYQKGAYITNRYLAGPPDYIMRCRYCKKTWEDTYGKPDDPNKPNPPWYIPKPDVAAFKTQKGAS